MFWRKDDEKEKLERRKRILEASQKVKEGEINYLPVVYQAFAGDDSVIMEVAAEAVAGFMAKLDASHIIRLDEQFRQYTSMEWSIDWREVQVEKIHQYITDEQIYRYVIRLGTFHPNGYFREKCVQELWDDAKSLPYLILRLNDWVEIIRGQISCYIENIICKASIYELLQCLPFLEKVKRGGRKEREDFLKLQNEIELKICERIGELELHKVAEFDYKIKRYLYCIIVKPQAVNKSQADFLLSKERNSTCKRIIIQRIIKEFNCSIEELDFYLTSKSVVVRRAALDKKYDLLKNCWSGIEELLLDDSKGIRESVCYIINKHSDADILEYYKGKLDGESVRTAILGIGENGKTEDAKLIEGYVHSEDAKCVRNAIKSISMLRGNKAEALYWEFLFDKRISVSGSAYRAIKEHHICCGAEKLYAEYLKCEMDYIKRYLLVLLMHEPSWKALPYLLLLYNCEDVSLRDRIRKVVWNRSVYAKISMEEADRIKEILHQSGIEFPKRLVEEIELDLKYVAKP